MPRSKMDLPLQPPSGVEAGSILFDPIKIKTRFLEGEIMGYNGRPPKNQPMGHVPPPPPPMRRPRVAERPTQDLFGIPVYDSPYIANTGMAQSSRATAENIGQASAIAQAAANLSRINGMSMDEAMRAVQSALLAPGSAMAKPIAKPEIPGADLSKPRKRKITLE